MKKGTRVGVTSGKYKGYWGYTIEDNESDSHFVKLYNGVEKELPITPKS